MSQPLSTSPIPGTRDFFPEEMSIRQQVFATLYEVVESFGYQRYDGPMLEPFELYAAKSSEEIVSQQTYLLSDRGDRRLVVRPEMTPTVARMIAARAGSVALPARWYSHPNLWRYERKQRGRYREHWQVNVDVFGAATWQAEAEIFELLAEMMFALKARAEDFIIRASDREMMRTVLVREAGVPEEKINETFGVLDRLEKVPREDSANALRQLGVASPERVFDWLERPIEDYRTELTKLGIALDAFRLLEVMTHGIATSQPVTLKFDPKIFRGFTYYTSTVFELYDVNPANPRSIAGGGRYDNLTALFGGSRPIPGIGFGMGDVTLIDFLETHGLAPKPSLAPHAIVLAPDESTERAVRRVAAELRQTGLRVVTPLETRKLGKQLEKASKEGIRFAVIVGGNEEEKKMVQLRDMARSAQAELSQAGLGAHIRRLLDEGVAP